MVATICDQGRPNEGAIQIESITESTQKISKWDHLFKLHQADSKINDCKILLKLTDCHVMPDKIPNMKVW